MFHANQSPENLEKNLSEEQCNSSRKPTRSPATCPVRGGPEAVREAVTRWAPHPVTNGVKWAGPNIFNKSCLDVSLTGAVWMYCGCETWLWQKLAESETSIQALNHTQLPSHIFLEPHVCTWSVKSGKSSNLCTLAGDAGEQASILYAGQEEGDWLIIRTPLIVAGSLARRCWATLSGILLYWKLQRFALRLTTQISANTAPATKSHTPRSRNAAPARKSETPTSPSIAPATKSDTVTLLSCYLAELLLCWAVTLLLLYWAVTWAVTLLNCYFTVTLLSCYFTVTLLSCYFTGVLLLYWTLCIFKSP